jgi:hypothetical protein
MTLGNMRANGVRSLDGVVLAVPSSGGAERRQLGLTTCQCQRLTIAVAKTDRPSHHLLLNALFDREGALLSPS